MKNSASQTEIYTYPSMVRRLKALFIDFVIVLLIFSACSQVLRGSDDYSVSLKVFVFIFCVVLYDPLLVSFYGGTLGHRAVGLRVKKVDDPEKNISVVAAFERVVVKALLGWISFISITFDSERRAIHDYASGAVVRFK